MTAQMEASARRNWFDGCAMENSSRSQQQRRHRAPQRGKMVMCSLSLVRSRSRSLTHSAHEPQRALSGKTHLWKEMARNGCIVNGAEAAAAF